MLHQLVSTCPTCGQEFCLRGSKLRQWIKNSRHKEVKVGPYCSYVCSCRANIRVAIDVRAGRRTSSGVQ